MNHDFSRRSMENIFTGRRSITEHMHRHCTCNGQVRAGYGGKVAPPLNRFYMGGENDIRGFDILEHQPDGVHSDVGNGGSSSTTTALSRQKVINANGTVSYIGMPRRLFPLPTDHAGRRPAGVTNYEYRIPIFGPVTLAPFVDAGVDLLLLPSQLGLNPGQVTNLNSLYPQADFGRRAYIAPHTQVPRVSTGLELQVLMPVVNAPFRLYFAYNPSYVNTVLTPPVVADRSFFPNNATYQEALSEFRNRPAVP